MDQLFLALDGNSLMHRAFHAIGDLDDGHGNPTGAVFGFMGMLLRLLAERRPDYAAVAFDMHGPTFRHEAYADYKGTRRPTDENLRPQFPMVKALLGAMGITVLEVPRYEADDILGTLAARCEDAGIPALLVTGDRDAMQLVSQNVHVLYTKKGISDTEEFDPERVRERFGVRPAQVPDLKGLMGDASDNIPGVPGVGEKTAVRLLTRYGTLEETLLHTDGQQSSLRAKLEIGADSARQSKWLATICRDAPVPGGIEDCRIGSLAGGVPMFRELGFRTLMGKLEALVGETAQAAPSGGAVEARDERGECAILTTQEEITAWIGDMTRAALWIDEQAGRITLADARRWAAIPLKKDLLTEGLEIREAFEALKPMWQKNASLCLFGAKKLLRELDGAGFALKASYVSDDVQLAGWLLDPLTPAKTLDQITEDRPADARGIWDVCEEQQRKLEKAGMLKLYRELEMPLMGVLLEMERCGVTVQRGELQRQGLELAEQETALKNEIFVLTGGEFNLNSPKQLGEVLFEKLGLPAGRKTSRGWSTDAETLEALAPVHPVVEKILEYRKAAKLRATYIDGLTAAIEEDGRVRTCFDQTATVTGRLASNEPNLQNIPVRTEQGREIRRAFTAPAGWLLVDADYSQIELRILAHMSKDPGMISAFRRGLDIHAATASEVYEVPLKEVTPAMRSAAKAVNFGIVYGISDFGLARNIKVTRREAAEFIERYFSRYPGVRLFMQDAVEQGKRRGYATTLLGRRRPLPELLSSNYNTRMFGERAAMNTPVQGTAADLIKLAMLNVTEEIEAEGLQAHLILQVHDELIVEAPIEEEQEVRELLIRCMEGAADLLVPLTAEVQSGKTWYEAK